MVRYSTTGTPPTINAGGDASNGGSTSALVNNRTYFIESSFQVGSSINYVTTLKEFPTSASNINFTSTGTGTHTFTAIGLAGDKDMFHLKNHGYVVGDMLRYRYPSGGHFGVTTEATELKDYYFVERLFGTHNFQVNFTIGELSPKLQEFIGLTATSSSVNVSFTAVGFTAPLVYSVSSGTLPAGLSLNTSTGAITGTPNTAYSQATVRILVTDASASSDFADVTFQVNPAPNLYAFTTATFTSGGVNGPDGPNVTQARNGLGNPSWAATYLNMSRNGYQRWTVPQSATYRIRAMGASGGRTPSHNGGRGIIYQGDVALTQGQIIQILVGQGGTNKSDDCNTGAGGGTFVVRDNNTPIIIAGGGGGTARTAGRDGVNQRNGGTSSNGQSGGVNGAGGNCEQGPSGAGFTGNGCAAGWGSLGGFNNGIAQSFSNGGQGGSSTQQSPNVIGGFGGGASGHGNCCIGGGGAGGYSGGAAASSCEAGGGGGSFFDSVVTNQSVPGFNSYSGNASSGTWAPNGSVTITRL
jgi:hypothetical protein